MTELQQSEARLAKLIEDMSGSIQAEIHSEVTALEAKMDAGFDRVEAATLRNTRTLAGGASAIAALNRWAARQSAAPGTRRQEAKIILSYGARLGATYA